MERGDGRQRERYREKNRKIEAERQRVNERNDREGERDHGGRGE